MARRTKMKPKSSARGRRSQTELMMATLVMLLEAFAELGRTDEAGPTYTS